MDHAAFSCQQDLEHDHCPLQAATHVHSFKVTGKQTLPTVPACVSQVIDQQLA